MPVLAAGTAPQITPSSVRPLLLSAIMITLPGTSACAAALLFMTLSCRAKHHISLCLSIDAAAKTNIRDTIGRTY